MGDPELGDEMFFNFRIRCTRALFYMSVLLLFGFFSFCEIDMQSLTFQKVKLIRVSCFFLSLKAELKVPLDRILHVQGKFEDINIEEIKRNPKDESEM